MSGQEYTTSMNARTIAALSLLACVAAASVAEATVPFSPDRVRRERIDSSHVRITWLDVSDNEDGFEILRRAAFQTDDDLQVRGTVGPDVTEFIDDDIAGTTWVYRVRAFNEDGASDFSNECYVNRPRAAQPLYFNVRLIGLSVARLRWHDRSAGERGFELQRADFGKDNWKTVAVTEPNIEVYDDYTLKPATSFTYRLRALGRPAICWDNSKWTPERSLTTKGGTRILEIDLRGNGNGLVKSDPEGIRCGMKDDHCAAEFPLASEVYLTAKPGTYSHFGGWQDYGRCEGLEDTCRVTMEESEIVGAPFRKNR
jgi:hypothetical protein